MSLDNWQQRTELLLGKEKLELLNKANVLVAGLGGVGGIAAEMLCRSGIGNMTIIDADTFHPTNRNRQIGALKSTDGLPKTTVMKNRLLDINPNLNLNIINEFITEEKIKQLTNKPWDYVVDAIDSLNPKIFLIYYSLQNNQKLISSMAAGGKINPSLIEITDFSKTYNDKLARMLRKRLHKVGIYSGFDVVFSSELVDKKAVIFTDNEKNKKTTVGTISYMPMLFGAYMASYVIREIANLSINKNNKQ